MVLLWMFKLLFLWMLKWLSFLVVNVVVNIDVVVVDVGLLLLLWMLKWLLLLWMLK